MKREFDLRFEGLSEMRPTNAKNIHRVRKVRNTLLAAAGGFTELPPNAISRMLSRNYMERQYTLYPFRHEL